MTLRRRPPGGASSAKPFRGKRPDQRHTHKDTVRGAAAWVVERTTASLAPSSTFLDSAKSRCDVRDHRLLRELALGTLRWLRRLDVVIAQASSRPIERIDPKLHALLRVATYQLLFLDRMPVHAAVHEAVEAARRVTHRGGVSFANAVLRRIARDRDLASWPVDAPDEIVRMAIEHSHPDFLVRRWVSRYGMDETRALLVANNRPKPLPLLAFRDRGGREVLAEALIDQGVEVEPSSLAPLGLLVRDGNPLESVSYQAGAFYLQDEASQAVALIPPPKPGERILDAAASPGGKGFSILAAEPEARVTFADVDAARVARLRANLTRLGRDVPVMIADAGQPACGKETFDRVILDLPCTGTGTLRKHPELKWRISEPEVGRLARQSLRLLAGSANVVRSGGLLVAITCSLEPEENEAVVARFLDENPAFSPVDLASVLAYPMAEQITGMGAWQIRPAGDHDGFTVHVLARR